MLLWSILWNKIKNSPVKNKTKKTEFRFILFISHNVFIHYVCLISSQTMMIMTIDAAILNDTGRVRKMLNEVTGHSRKI